MTKPNAPGMAVTKEIKTGEGYYKSALYPICDQLNRALKQWVMRKFKSLRWKILLRMHDLVDFLFLNRYIESGMLAPHSAVGRIVRRILRWKK